MNRPTQASLLQDREPDLNEQIAEVERELKMRHRVYPRLIENGTLSPVVSAYRIGCLEAVLGRLQRLREASG